jgi:hypothetical protein
MPRLTIEIFNEEAGLREQAMHDLREWLRFAGGG